ncbi:hypothetical protein [Lysinibacillus sp. SGAir0095]|uniref:hypothetical protein n=1 Tax=Lysinibacillus sp. SGAir0095 TaxID=2070463 RepID=UPI0010CCE333|nr:hypothetical protein [Lysinibacillus sp. SGAir0095]QCR33548.1 hypothetical protein C1N55_15930 [Lysinibacillus sp. SGAir0095]
MNDKIFQISGGIETDLFKDESEFNAAFMDWVKSIDGTFVGVVAEHEVEDDDEDEYPSYSFRVNVKK